MGFDFKFKPMRNLLLFLATFYPLILLSQNTSSDYNPINTVADFLNESSDARGVGLGNSGAATQADINSMYWNPAKYIYITEDQSENMVDYPKDLGFSFTSNRGYYTYTENTSDLGFTTYKVIGKQTIAASVKYHRWGDFYFTDAEGSPIGKVNPLEFSVDAAYSRRLSKVFSFGTAIRYIHSDIFRDFSYIQGNPTKVGRSLAIDLALLYRKKLNIKNLDDNLLSFGLNISNIGNKITYLDIDPDYLQEYQKEFIPTNLRLGGSFSFEKDIHTLTVSADINKLLVPTSPIYYEDSVIDGNPVIYKGMDPHVNVFKGMIQSFYDAPNGFKEEMQEYYFGVGFEYWHDKLIAVRAGYYHEHKNKGNRKNINIGTGVRYKFIAFDVAYSIIPDKPRNEEGDLTYQRNNWYLNLIFQINTKKKK